MILGRGPHDTGPVDVSEMAEEVAGGIIGWGSSGTIAVLTGRPSTQSCRLCAHHRAATMNEAAAPTCDKATRSALRDMADEASVRGPQRPGVDISPGPTLQCERNHRARPLADAYSSERVRHAGGGWASPRAENGTSSFVGPHYGNAP